MRLADRAARQGVKQFVFASSGSVYGVEAEPRVTEDMPLCPISEYNKTKMVAERVILSYARLDGDDDRPAGDRLRAVPAHAAGPDRQPADDAGADERER